ncbi:hypothetical protein [Actinoplanes sp. NPDC026670]|uniref:hypothetical protein n=1 Tax=Actinoplanes sp. NPDC026670 TaxID=3154700 RepID=UPI0033CDAD0C
MTSPRSPLPLIAVVGPVPPKMFAAFVDHYRSHGVDDVLVAFHFTEHASPDRRAELLECCEQLVGRPVLVSTGPWHEHIHGDLRDHLRRRAGTGWHVLADVDEFHGYPRPPEELVAEAEARGSRQVGGVLFDRVSADGALADWAPEKGLDASYPLGGFLTSRLLGGNPRKVVLAHSSLPLVLGSHYSPDGLPDDDLLVPVHHFKWTERVLPDLRRRVAEHSSGAWWEVTPAIRTEAAALLEHIENHDGRIDVTDPGMSFQPASVEHLPDRWAEESRDVAERYREYRRWSAT